MLRGWDPESSKPTNQAGTRLVFSAAVRLLVDIPRLFFPPDPFEQSTRSYFTTQSSCNIYHMFQRIVSVDSSSAFRIIRPGERERSAPGLLSRMSSVLPMFQIRACASSPAVQMWVGDWGAHASAFTQSLCRCSSATGFAGNLPAPKPA